MHKTHWSDLGAVRVRFFDGRIDHYGSLVGAVRRVGWYEIDKLDRRDFGPDLSEWIRAARLWLTRNKLVFLDDLGLVIPIAVVRRVAMEQGLHDLPNFWGRWRPRRRRGQPWTYEFRNGPVPGIRCSRGGGWRGFRTLDTTQEIRENDFLGYDEDAIEHGVTVRGRRKRGQIPTGWDDLRNGSYSNRNWKNYRGTQWKPR